MNLCVRIENGIEITGRAEEWVAAILRVLTPDQRDAVFAAVAKKQVAYRTPGSYVLHAEPGHLGLILGRR